MASYLPKDSPNSSPYAEGGGLYAIGMENDFNIRCCFSGVAQVCRDAAGI